MSNVQRTVVITGGTGGIGLYSAIGIAKTGARVIVIGRNAERGDVARQKIIEVTQNQDVELVVGDVSTKSNIDELISSVLNKLDTIDVLINNAGYLGSERTQNEDGFEMHFAVNVVAPYRFTKGLLSALKSSDNPRVLNITGGDKPDRIDIDNLQAEKGFKGLMTYTHSKSIMESMSISLAEELEPEGVSVNIVFPGRASTSMTRSLTSQSLPGLMKLMLPFFKLYFSDDGGKSASKAATSTIWAATTPDIAGMNGKYFDTNMKEQRLHPTAYDADVQRAIMDVITQQR